MKRQLTIPFLLAGVLTGSILVSGCGILNPHVAKAETAEFTSDQPFDSIYIDTTASNVILQRAEDGVLRVVSKEADLYRHTMQVRDNTLYIEKQRDPSFSIQLNNITLEILVLLPKEAYDRAFINTSSGSIRLRGDLRFREAALKASSGAIQCLADVTETLSANTSSGSQYLGNVSADVLTAESSSGSIHLSAISGKTASVKASSGTLDLDHTVLSGKLELQTSSGNIRFAQCDAADIRIKASSGDVSGSLLSEKNFSIHTSSGNVSVPAPVSGAGPCDIRTSSGDIHITVEPDVV